MCEHYSLLLSAYLDDEVTLAERAMVEGHLVGCADCRAELHALRETVSLAAYLPELLPPADLRDRIFLRTTRRVGLWERARRAALRPAVWSPALAMGVVGVIALASLNGKAPAPSASPQAKVALPKTAKVARKPVPAPTRTIVAAVEKPVRAPVPVKKESTGIHRFMERIEETLSPSEPAAPAVKPAPQPMLAQAAPAPRAPRPAPTRKKAVTAPRPAMVASKKTPASADPMTRLKRSIATVGDKIKGISRSRPKSPGDDAASGDGSSALTMPNDETTVAMAPPMVTMPDMPAPSAAGDPGPEAVASARATNPVADTLTKLAEPPKKRKTDLDAMVEQINANALSTASTARQIKVKFARYKF
jgi:hypothetical protein